MEEPHKRSHLRKMAKRRKNIRMIAALLIIAGVLLFVLLVLWIFGDKDDESSKKASDAETSRETEDKNLSESLEIKGSEENSKDEDLIDEDDTEDASHQVIKTTKVDPSDDNVIKAYTGDWQVVETEQKEPHTTNYADGTQDRIEIKEGVMLATGLNEDLITWWVGNGGDQKVIATVSDLEEEKIYRVYLAWIEDEGWQPTKVEQLIKNDKKS